MNFEIDKTFFEKAVPAFKSATANAFDKMAMFLEAADAALVKTIDKALNEVQQSPHLADQAKTLICVTATRNAVPQLDLTMTAQGFGIVSNGNISPASRERVLALQEQLRQQESNAMELFCIGLLSTSWKETAMADETVWGLMWCPLFLRRYGVNFQGKKIYYEEMELLKTDIFMAEEQLVNIVSPELYDVLLKMTRHRDSGLDPIYRVVLERSCKFIAAVLGGNERNVSFMKKSLQEVLNDYKETLKEYSQSATFQSITLPQYENKKDDPCVFF